MRRVLLAVMLGLGAGVLTWAALRASVQPPRSWLWVYVRSGCGASEQAIADVREAPNALAIALLPLDAEAADEVCPLTLARVQRVRPYLALVPERWACSVLRSHARGGYEALAVDDGAVPVYQLAERVSLGWNPRRRAAIMAGAIEEGVF